MDISAVQEGTDGTVADPISLTLEPCAVPDFLIANP
jgi:hypothetical protein